MNKSLKLITLFFTILLLQNCTSDDRAIVLDNPPPSGDYANGVFVLNEGGFNNSNASVSFIDASGQAYHNVFFAVNGRGLGDVAQNIGFNGDLAYILVNNSNTVEVVNRYTFESVATIETDILNPRYIAFFENKGYITNWGDPNDTTDDYVAVLNIETNTITATIPVAEGPEAILNKNGTLYVAHKGGYGYGNSISIINAISQTVTASIQVGDVPGDMVLDNNNLYVICSGKASWTGDETSAGIYKINSATNLVEAQITFSDGVHPGFLKKSNNSLLYTLNASLYNIELNDFTLPETALFNTSAQNIEVLYGFNIINDKIYISDAKDYTSNGEVLVYSLEGDFQNGIDVKIIPNGCYNNN